MNDSQKQQIAEALAAYRKLDELQRVVFEMVLSSEPADPVKRKRGRPRGSRKQGEEASQ